MEEVANSEPKVDNKGWTTTSRAGGSQPGLLAISRRRPNDRAGRLSLLHLRPRRRLRTMLLLRSNLGLPTSRCGIAGAALTGLRMRSCRLRPTQERRMKHGKTPRGQKGRLGNNGPAQPGRGVRGKNPRPLRAGKHGTMAPGVTGPLILLYAVTGPTGVLFLRPGLPRLPPSSRTPACSPR